MIDLAIATASSHDSVSAAPVAESVNERLRILRGNRSLRAFANDLDVHYNTLLNYERGRTPDYNFLLMVCEREKCDRGWLFFGTQPDVSEDSLSDEVAAAVFHHIRTKGEVTSDSQFRNLVRETKSALKNAGGTGISLPSSQLLQAYVMVAEHKMSASL